MMRFTARAAVTITAFVAFVTFVHADSPPPSQPPFQYIWARAYHILPETHNNESGYFALVDGLDGKMYVGTCKYHENSFLVEFNPETQRQRIVVDTHRACGINDAKGFASQAKIHTRCFVGPSGMIYMGSMQGYKTQEDTSEYPGGYVFTYDPKTQRTENLGMPKSGISVIDVSADENRGLIYAVMLTPDNSWMVYDRKTKEWRDLGPKAIGFCNTIIDGKGRANIITEDSRLAQYDPETGQVTVRDLVLNGEKLPTQYEPAWRMAPDGHTTYLVNIDDPTLKIIDLYSDGETVEVKPEGKMLDGPEPHCKIGLDVARDGRVYVVVSVKNNTGFGDPNKRLQHLTRYTPATGARGVIEDLGVIAITNPNFMNLEQTAYADKFQYLPDRTLAPEEYHFALKCNHVTGEVYITTIYPFALLRISPPQ